MALIPRIAEAKLLKLMKGYPAVVLTGPRQSGKTTLARKLFADKSYTSLEDIDVREFAESDPRGFLGQFPNGAVLDEVQRSPDLFSYLQSRLDEDKRMGLFVLTGSQQFDLLSGVSQSLAGRVARLTLLPFSLVELQQVNKAPGKLEKLLFDGLYPPVHDRKLDAADWYNNYVGTYLERDVRQLTNVRDLGSFQRFVRMCAARSGQLLNLSALGADCGITHNTAKAWISILEASYIIHLLHPHHKNFNKRLVKSPKLYFYDAGLAASLLNIQDAEQLSTHSARGSLFETWVVSEFVKHRLNRGLLSNCFFWRDNRGNEIDLLIEHSEKLFPVEIKSGQTIAADYFTGLEKYSAWAKDDAGDSTLIYGGAMAQERQQARVIPWKKIDQAFIG
ncbi:MAG: ATP-binding protein [Proteobacteria bacterium]|nr:ATP-binding protein [Pseudomonadota bacterium]